MEFSNLVGCKDDIHRNNADFKPNKVGCSVFNVIKVNKYLTEAGVRRKATKWIKLYFEKGKIVQVFE